MPYLIVQHPGGRNQRILLERSPLVIGRGASCDLQVVDAKISRRHCQLSEHDGQWHLEDLGSRNKTWMGLEAVDNVLLSDGDQFRIGRTHIVFRTEVNATEAFEEPPTWS
jgi:pSer/pThr/pTyr-binding forkhead associated (FHA) protein